MCCRRGSSPPPHPTHSARFRSASRRPLVSDAHRSPPLAMAGAQVFIGNIPSQLSDDEIRAELAAYSVRPWKIVVTRRDKGQEPNMTANM